MHLIGGWWAQIWPNLVASALTAGPMFVWHHRRIKAHITATAERAAAPVRPAVDIRTAVDAEPRRTARTTWGGP